jgi:hypothetical protein
MVSRYILLTKRLGNDRFEDDEWIHYTRKLDFQKIFSNIAAYDIICELVENDMETSFYRFINVHPNDVGSVKKMHKEGTLRKELLDHYESCVCFYRDISYIPFHTDMKATRQLHGKIVKTIYDECKKIEFIEL